MTKFADFDGFFEETEEKPVVLRLLGTEWHLPPDAPADRILRIQRAQAAGLELTYRAKAEPDEQITQEEAARYRDDLDGFDLEEELRGLVGDDMVDAWFALGLQYRQMTTVFWWLFGVYVGTNDPRKPLKKELSAEGEAKAPTTGATDSGPSAEPTSSSSGLSSKPISAVSSG